MRKATYALALIVAALVGVAFAPHRVTQKRVTAPDKRLTIYVQ